MENSIYEVPTQLQEYVLDQRGISTYPATQAEVRQRRDALETLRSQWANIVDTATFGQINDLIGIRRADNGRLVTTFATDHTYSDGPLIAVPYRFVTKQLVERWLSEHLGWLEVTAETEPDTEALRSVTLAPVEGTSRLRVRAFSQAVHEAKAQLGSLISLRSSVEGASLVIDARETYVNGRYSMGVQVHQIFWMLAVAKEVNQNLTALMRAALKATRAEAEVKIIKRDTSASFDTFFQKRGHQLRQAKGKSIENLPIIDPDTETARTWGIEVEAAGARGVDAPSDSWERKGDGSLRTAYTSNDRSSDDCPYHDHRESILLADGTWVENDEYEDEAYCDWLNYEDDYDDDDYESSYSDCAEFVSPILSHAGSMDLKTLVDRLKREPQNDSAGVHVHVGADDLTPRQIGALVFAYSAIEPLIEDAYRRDRRNYCKERSSKDVLEVVKSSKKPGIVKRYQDATNGANVIHYGDRYVSVNLCALEAHGTVEFRSMGPVYDYDHLIKWALFCREMVSIAKLNLPVKTWTSIKSWKDLSRVLHTYGPELQGHTLAALDSFADAEEKETVTA